MATKRDMCKRDFVLSQNGTLPTKNPVSASGDTLEPGSADRTEVILIFTYLGGVDNGFVEYRDVERFFNGLMPENKTKFMLEGPLLAHLMGVLARGAAPVQPH